MYIQIYSLLCFSECYIIRNETTCIVPLFFRNTESRLLDSWRETPPADQTGPERRRTRKATPRRRTLFPDRSLGPPPPPRSRPGLPRRRPNQLVVELRDRKSPPRRGSFSTFPNVPALCLPGLPACLPARLPTPLTYPARLLLAANRPAAAKINRPLSFVRRIPVVGSSRRPWWGVSSPPTSSTPSPSGRSAPARSPCGKPRPSSCSGRSRRSSGRT